MAKKLEKIDEFRRDLTNPFFLRGCPREEVFHTGKPLNTAALGIPAYYVDPRYKMAAGEWISRLQATIHGAVGRAIRKIPPRVDLTKWRDVEGGKLPALLVFDSAKPFKNTSGLRSFQMNVRFSRRLILPKIAFNRAFKHYRPEYEQASVHGMQRPTFTEDVLTGSHFAYKNELHLDNRMLFKVEMNKEDFSKIMRTIEGKLRGRNSSIAALRDSSKRTESWRIINSIYGRTETALFDETTPLTPDLFIFYSEASRFMTNKFVNKALRWANKNLPKGE